MDDPAEPDKYLWIATKGGGLNRLDKTTGDFSHLTTKDGLPDDVVYGILTDAAGNIWGSTNKGIFVCWQLKTRVELHIDSETLPKLPAYRMMNLIQGLLQNCPTGTLLLVVSTG